jgi:hypothetical protein
VTPRLLSSSDDQHHFNRSTSPMLAGEGAALLVRTTKSDHRVLALAGAPPSWKAREAGLSEPPRQVIATASSTRIDVTSVSPHPETLASLDLHALSPGVGPRSCGEPSGLPRLWWSADATRLVFWDGCALTIAEVISAGAGDRDALALHRRWLRPDHEDAALLLERQEHAHDLTLEGGGRLGLMSVLAACPWEPRGVESGSCVVCAVEGLPGAAFSLVGIRALDAATSMLGNVCVDMDGGEIVQIESCVSLGGVLLLLRRDTQTRVFFVRLSGDASLEAHPVIVPHGEADHRLAPPGLSSTATGCSREGASCLALPRFSQCSSLAMDDASARLAVCLTTGHVMLVNLSHSASGDGTLQLSPCAQFSPTQIPNDRFSGATFSSPVRCEWCSDASEGVQRVGMAFNPLIRPSPPPLAVSWPAPTTGEGGCWAVIDWRCGGVSACSASALPWRQCSWLERKGLAVLPQGGDNCVAVFPLCAEPRCAQDLLRSQKVLAAEPAVGVAGGSGTERVLVVHRRGSNWSRVDGCLPVPWDTVSLAAVGAHSVAIAGSRGVAVRRPGGAWKALGGEEDSLGVEAHAMGWMDDQRLIVAGYRCAVDHESEAVGAEGNTLSNWGAIHAHDWRLRRPTSLAVRCNAVWRVNGRSPTTESHWTAQVGLEREGPSPGFEWEIARDTTHVWLMTASRPSWDEDEKHAPPLELPPGVRVLQVCCVRDQVCLLCAADGRGRSATGHSGGGQMALLWCSVRERAGLELDTTVWLPPDNVPSIPGVQGGVEQIVWIRGVDDAPVALVRSTDGRLQKLELHKGLLRLSRVETDDGSPVLLDRMVAVSDAEQHELAESVFGLLQGARGQQWHCVHWKHRERPLASEGRLVVPPSSLQFAVCKGATDGELCALQLVSHRLSSIDRPMTWKLRPSTVLVQTLAPDAHALASVCGSSWMLPEVVSTLGTMARSRHPLLADCVRAVSIAVAGTPADAGLVAAIARQVMDDEVALRDVVADEGQLTSLVKEALSSRRFAVAASLVPVASHFGGVEETVRLCLDWFSKQRDQSRWVAIAHDLESFRARLAQDEPNPALAEEVLSTVPRGTPHPSPGGGDKEVTALVAVATSPALIRGPGRLRRKDPTSW